MLVISDQVHRGSGPNECNEKPRSIVEYFWFPYEFYDQSCISRKSRLYEIHIHFIEKFSCTIFRKKLIQLPYSDIVMSMHIWVSDNVAE